MEVQEAIENIESNTAGFGASDQQPLTILIIAHRLTSIKNAKNLLFIEGRDIINAYKKDTPEYEQAMHRLKNFTYAYGEGEEEPGYHQRYAPYPVLILKNFQPEGTRDTEQQPCGAYDADRAAALNPEIHEQS